MTPQDEAALVAALSRTLDDRRLDGHWNRAVALDCDPAQTLLALAEECLRQRPELDRLIAALGGTQRVLDRYAKVVEAARAFRDAKRAMTTSDWMNMATSEKVTPIADAERAIDAALDAAMAGAGGES